MFAPFHYAFVQRGMLEALLLSIPAGILGTWIVLRGLAFFSHAVGTAAFPGLVLAAGLGWPGPAGAAVAVTAYTLGVESLASRRESNRETTTGLVLVGALALGVVLASDVFHSGANVETLLFGSLLLVGSSDVRLAAIAAAVTVLLSATLGRRWLAVGFERETASGPEASRFDPHWWHDPRNAEAAVRAIRATLVALDPSHRTGYRRRAAAYLAKLRALDRSLAVCGARREPAPRGPRRRRLLRWPRRRRRRDVRARAGRADRDPRPQRRREVDSLPHPPRRASSAAGHAARPGAAGVRPADGALPAGLSSFGARRGADGHALPSALVATARAARAAGGARGAGARRPRRARRRAIRRVVRGAAPARARRPRARPGRAGPAPRRAVLGGRPAERRAPRAAPRRPRPRRPRPPRRDPRPRADAPLRAGALPQPPADRVRAARDDAHADGARADLRRRDRRAPRRGGGRPPAAPSPPRARVTSDR